MTVRRVSFTVYRHWFDAIEAGDKLTEYRTDKPPWSAYFDNPPEEAVFLCGRRILRRPVRRVDRITVAGAKVLAFRLKGYKDDDDA